MTFLLKDKVVYQGTTYVIGQVNDDATFNIYIARTPSWKASYRPARHVQNVKAEALKAYAPPADKRSNAICQCCGRQIESKKGLIAHHGYERPGQGWQTSSCMGARYLPFQISRDRLGEMIEESIKPHLEGLHTHRASLDVEGVKVPGPVLEYPKDHPKFAGRHEKANQYQLIVGPDWKPDHSWEPGYDKYLSWAKGSVESSIRLVTMELENQQARYDGWKPSEVK
jgi:hypothetical protein